MLFTFLALTSYYFIILLSFPSIGFWVNLFLPWTIIVNVSRKCKYILYNFFLFLFIKKTCNCCNTRNTRWQVPMMIVTDNSSVTTCLSTKTTFTGWLLYFKYLKWRHSYWPESMPGHLLMTFRMHWHSLFRVSKKNLWLSRDTILSISHTQLVNYLKSNNLVKFLSSLRVPVYLCLN